MTSGSYNPELPPRQIADIAIEVVNHISAMVAYWDRNQVCRFANNAYRQWFGKSPDAVIGSSMKELLGPLYDLNLPYILRALQGEVQVFEREIPIPGEGIRHSLATYTPDIADGVVRGFFVHVADVTSLKIAEMALRESEVRFRLLADSAPVMIWMTDATGACTYLNNPWLQFTGRTREEGLAFGWSEAIHPDDKETKMQEALRCFAAQQPIRSEFRLRRFDGQYRYVLDVGVPRLSEEGLFLGYVGSCIDITEQKLAQERLFESQKLESLGRLAGGVAHDFNNLLTAITGYTELAQMQVSSESEVARFLIYVRSAAERAAALTQQLLMYARRQMVEFTNVNLNQVILGMDPLLRRTIGESYELVTMLEERLWGVKSNASQVEQVLMNLIVNARDAMPTGGRIVVETANIVLDYDYADAHPGVSPGEYAMLAVSDNGPGMTKETQARVFEPFFTTKAMGKGTGLGLATCYGIIKQNSGTISVYSEPGQGTTFRLYLPRLQEAAIIEESVPQADLPSGTETVLLVDDEQMVRDIAARVLRSHGYRVLEASNGAEALHVHSEWGDAIDLLLTDVVMPLMGGKELAQRLQQLRPEIKVLYMSGYTQNVILQQGALRPDVTLITKPFTSSDLVKAVREVLTAAPDLAGVRRT